MIWTTWRQFRTQTWVTLGGLIVFGGVLLLTAIRLADLWRTSGAADCTTDCANAINAFTSSARAGSTGAVYFLTIVGMYALPGLIGAFWGAPLVARELETGTHRLAWTQSVTRRRWLATKLAMIGSVTVAVAGLLSLAVSLWSPHLDKQDRIGPLLFAARGIVPMAYAAFAFAAGVAAGMLLRRTIMAMAVTIGVYVAAIAAMPLWIRERLLPTREVTTPLNLDNLSEFTMSQGGRMRLTGEPQITGGWITSNLTITPSGDPFVGPANPDVCNRTVSPQSCLDWVGTLGLRQSVTYHPLSHFWPLQLIESGLFLGLTLIIVAWCFHRIRRLS